MKALKWLYPGMKVKRWLALSFAGIILVSTGIAILLDIGIVGALERGLIRTLAPISAYLGITGTLLSVIVAFCSGGFFVVTGITHLIQSIASVLLPEGHSERLVDLVYTRRYLAKKGPQIVVIGGGTGLSTMLRGLKKYPARLTAIVTVADDGGSSGRIRNDLGILPPGDIRNTLAALADTEPLMEQLFQYRFHWGEGLEGHSFGNLFIAAMTDITGDFEQAIKESSRVLAVRGQVLPSTLKEVKLQATYSDGSTMRGESLIPQVGKSIERVELHPRDCFAVPEALQAIRSADLIILGPGSLYTSVLPNLLVSGIAEAVKQSSAPKVYVCNVMTQPGETDGYTAADHVQALVNHVGPGVIDYAIVNDATIPQELLIKYEAQGAFPVVADVERIKQMGIKPVSRPLISLSDLVRHNPDDLAKCILDISWRSQIIAEFIS